MDTTVKYILVTLLGVHSIPSVACTEFDKSFEKCMLTNLADETYRKKYIKY